MLGGLRWSSDWRGGTVNLTEWMSCLVIETGTPPSGRSGSGFAIRMPFQRFHISASWIVRRLEARRSLWPLELHRPRLASPGRVFVTRFWFTSVFLKISLRMTSTLLIVATAARLLRREMNTQCASTSAGPLGYRTGKKDSPVGGLATSTPGSAQGGTTGMIKTKTVTTELAAPNSSRNYGRASSALAESIPSAGARGGLLGNPPRADPALQLGATGVP